MSIAELASFVFEVIALVRVRWGRSGASLEQALSNLQGSKS
jgi:hypothetical protein